MKFKTQFNPSYKGTEGQRFTLPSKTKPDDSMTVAQMLRQHQSGIIPNVSDYGQDGYFETEIPQVHDLVELMERRAELNHQQLDLEDAIKVAELERRNRKQQADAEKRPPEQPPKEAPKPPQKPSED
jgi:hypothetical protein